MLYVIPVSWHVIHVPVVTMGTFHSVSCEVLHGERSHLQPVYDKIVKLLPSSQVSPREINFAMGKLWGGVKRPNDKMIVGKQPRMIKQ